MLKFRELYEPNVSAAMFPTLVKGLAVSGGGLVAAAVLPDIFIAKLVSRTLVFGGVIYVQFVWISVIFEWEHALSRRALHRVHKALELLRK